MEPLDDGIFIAVEGLDGSGQSTQVEKLTEFFRSQDVPVTGTKEPTDNLVGGLIRGQLTGEWSADPECLQLLFAADRSHHLERDILPALQQGRVVITDRYMFSSLAFGATDLDLDWLEEINRPFRKPDITFYIDVSPETCMERMQETRFGLELFEKRQMLTAVEQNYDRLKERYDGIHIIDGEQPVDAVHGSVVDELQRFLAASTRQKYRDLLDRIKN